MGKKEKSKKGKGAEKTAAKTAKKAEMKHKKELSEKGEVSCLNPRFGNVSNYHEYSNNCICSRRPC